MHGMAHSRQRNSSKLDVEGSSPFSRSTPWHEPSLGSGTCGGPTELVLRLPAPMPILPSAPRRMERPKSTGVRFGLWEINSCAVHGPSVGVRSHVHGACTIRSSLSYIGRWAH
jgi:hypothetical protein